ncbi:Fic family protein [Paeniglutamicibacter antarcticus]|uniref:Fic family protein n=1 Tax=Arthrobacter terrae TaxID=2935737 RepID=A0A931CQ99_9MICC|nr:Fic family protein [Arthrobacter terrae]MBG0741062.1 Fic family protein [Arthrobacter terrae]
MPIPTISDLAGVVYSSGKVFDGLTTGRLDTEGFLLSGDTSGVASRQDLWLLQDLKAVAEFIIEHAEEPITANLLMQINGQMTRSASMGPGALRRADHQIGVNTIHGRHEPAAVTEEELDGIIKIALQQATIEEQAVSLFITLAKTQPFMDGNKRTGLFAANALLIKNHTQTVLTVPVDEGDPSVAEEFNGLLAQAYIFSEMEPVTEMLLVMGINSLPGDDEAEDLAKLEKFKAAIAQRAAEASQKH